MLDPCQKQTKHYDELKHALKKAKSKARRYRDILENNRGQMALQPNRYREKELAWIAELLSNGRYPRDVEERTPDDFSMCDPQRPLLKDCHEYALERANVYVGIRKLNTQLIEVERAMSFMRDDPGQLSANCFQGNLHIPCPTFGTEWCSKTIGQNQSSEPCIIMRQMN